MSKNVIIGLVVGLVIGGVAVWLLMSFGIGGAGTFLGKQTLSNTTTPTPTPTITTNTSSLVTTIPVKTEKLTPLANMPVQTWAVAYWVTKPSDLNAKRGTVPVFEVNSQGVGTILWKTGWVTYNQNVNPQAMDENTKHNFAGGIIELPSDPSQAPTLVLHDETPGSSFECKMYYLEN